MTRITVPLTMFFLLLGVLDPGQALAGKRSRRNKARCRSWCSANKSKGCTHCHRRRGCGAGYKSMKKFGKIASWHACRKNKFGKRGDKNEKRCRAYCASHKGCVKCTSRSCGKGVKLMKSFRGKGKNWRACKKTKWSQNSQKSLAAARKWCKDYKAISGNRCKIVKSGRRCPKGYYKSERIRVRWGRDHKICLNSKLASQRIQYCSGKATAYIEKALMWLNTHKSTILKGFKLQPHGYRNRKAHRRLKRKLPKVTVQCRDNLKKCTPKNGKATMGWSYIIGRQVQVCYKNHFYYCKLVETIMHETGHNAWGDIKKGHNHLSEKSKKTDTVYKLGYRTYDLCTGSNYYKTNIVPGGSGTSYDFRLR